MIVNDPFLVIVFLELMFRFRFIDIRVSLLLPLLLLLLLLLLELLQVLDFVLKILVAQSEVAHEVLSYGRDAHLRQLLMNDLKQVLHILILLIPTK